MSNNKKLWLGIFIGSFVFIQMLLIGMVLGIISLASNGSALSTGSYGGDLALTIICAILIPNVFLCVIGSYWYVNKNHKSNQVALENNPKANDANIQESKKTKKHDLNEQLPPEQVVIIQQLPDANAQVDPSAFSAQTVHPKTMKAIKQEIAKEEEQDKKNYFEPFKFFFADIKQEVNNSKKSKKQKPKLSNRNRLDTIPNQIVEPRQPSHTDWEQEEAKDIIELEPMRVPLSKRLKTWLKPAPSISLKDDKTVSTEVIEENWQDDEEPITWELPIEAVKEEVPEEKPRTIVFKDTDEETNKPVKPQEDKELADLKKAIQAQKDLIDEQNKAHEKELAEYKAQIEKELKAQQAKELEKLKKEQEEQRQKEQEEAKRLEAEVEAQRIALEKEQARLEKERLAQEQAAQQEAKRQAKEQERQAKLEARRQAKEAKRQAREEQKQATVEPTSNAKEQWEIIKEQLAQEAPEVNDEEDVNLDEVSDEEFEPVQAPKTWMSHTEVKPEDDYEPVQAPKTWMSQTSQADLPYHEIPVYAPFDGVAVPLTEVPDPYFSDGYAGEGLAVIPSSYDVKGIVDSGALTNIGDFNNIFVFTTNGIEIELNLGVDSSKCSEKTFKVKTDVNSLVSTNTNIAHIKEKHFRQAQSPISPITVKDLHGREIECVVYENQPVKQGDLLFIIK